MNHEESIPFMIFSCSTEEMVHNLVYTNLVQCVLQLQLSKPLLRTAKEVLWDTFLMLFCSAWSIEIYYLSYFEYRLFSITCRNHKFSFKNIGNAIGTVIALHAMKTTTCTWILIRYSYRWQLNKKLFQQVSEDPIHVDNWMREESITIHSMQV